MMARSGTVSAASRGARCVSSWRGWLCQNTWGDGYRVAASAAARASAVGSRAAWPRAAGRGGEQAPAAAPGVAAAPAWLRAAAATAALWRYCSTQRCTFVPLAGLAPGPLGLGCACCACCGLLGGGRRAAWVGVALLAGPAARPAAAARGCSCLSPSRKAKGAARPASADGRAAASWLAAAQGGLRRVRAEARGLCRAQSCMLQGGCRRLGCAAQLARRCRWHGRWRRLWLPCQHCGGPICRRRWGGAPRRCTCRRRGCLSRGLRAQLLLKVKPAGSGRLEIELVHHVGDARLLGR